MEQKKATVKSAVYKKSINTQYGESYIFDITMDNGDSGQYFSKTQDQSKFQQGKEVEYTIEKKVNGQYTNFSIKPVQLNGFTPGKGNPSYEHRRTALKCSVDLAIAGKIELGKIATYADSFMKFLNANEN